MALEQEAHCNPTRTAATTLSFRGSAYAATAAAPEMAADNNRIGVFAMEQRMPTRHRTPANPSPQSAGTTFARAMPATLIPIHALQVTK